MLAAIVLATMKTTYSHRFPSRTSHSRTLFRACQRRNSPSRPAAGPRDGYLETPSQCLHCERLFELNWGFCSPALCDRSGRRIWGPGQREEHCGRSERRRWTTPLPPPGSCQRPLWPRYSGGTELLGEIDPGGTKIALFCSPPSAVLFIYTCARARALVGTQLTRAFQCPGISRLTERTG